MQSCRRKARIRQQARQGNHKEGGKTRAGYCIDSCCCLILAFCGIERKMSQTSPLWQTRRPSGEQRVLSRSSWQSSSCNVLRLSVLEHSQKSGGRRRTVSHCEKSGWLQSLAQHFCATQRFLSSPAIVGGRQGIGKTQETEVKSHSGLSHGMRPFGRGGGSSSSPGQVSSISDVAEEGTVVIFVALLPLSVVAEPGRSKPSRREAKRGGRGSDSEKSKGASKSKLSSSSLFMSMSPDARGWKAVGTGWTEATGGES